MKKTRKKIIRASIVVILIASIGVVIASANIKNTSETETQKMFCEKRQLYKPGPIDYNITEDQKTELNELINKLKEQGANCSDIRSAVQNKLDEWGIIDQQLENEIAQAEKRLLILNREKELRNQGYNWDEIRSIIQDEFDIQNFARDDLGMNNRHSLGRESCRGLRGFMFDERSDL